MGTGTGANPTRSWPCARCRQLPGAIWPETGGSVARLPPTRGDVAGGREPVDELPNEGWLDVDKNILVIEPLLQAAAGIVTHPPGFLLGVRELTKQYNVLLIADEVARIAETVIAITIVGTGFQ